MAPTSRVVTRSRGRRNTTDSARTNSRLVCASGTTGVTGAIDTIVEYSTPVPSPFTTVFLEWMGGAVSRVDDDATAFPHRDAALSLTVAPKWEAPDRDEELTTWARTFHEAMVPYGDGVYANYLDRDESDRVAAAFGENDDHLVEVKRTWDPENRFHMNQNIDPSG